MSTQAEQHKAYSYYVLFVLFLANCLNAADRALVGLLAEPIKRHFDLSDTSIGLLSGFAFVLFYSVFGIPIARWIDRGIRRNILALGVSFWSLMTSACGLAASFPALILARMGVGVGESSCYPAALSLITDYFSVRKRPFAIALFQSAVFIGLVAGMVVAGRIASAFGWRMAFIVFGLPGLAVALLLVTTVREPQRGQQESDSAQVLVPRGWRQGLQSLWANREFRELTLALALFSMTTGIMQAWGPIFMMRIHDLRLDQVGTYLGPIIGGAGIVGTIIGGATGSTFARRRDSEAAPLLAPIMALPVCMAPQLIFVLAGDLTLSLISAALVALLTASHAGPCIAVALGTVRTSERGLASSLLLLGQMIIAFGLGPLLTGIISDSLLPALGADSLRVGLLVAPVAMALGLVPLIRVYSRMAAAGRLRNEAGPAVHAAPSSFKSS